MIAHFDYEKTKNRYLDLVNEQKQIEQKIKNNAQDEKALIALREDYRRVIEEKEQIYTENIEYFRDLKDN